MADAPMLQPIFIAGPTAVGKSEVALWLAEKIGGEILSADSMQVYRGLDVGTAKPAAHERARVPHHLIDLAELDEPFDAARFCSHAGRAVAEIVARRRVPIFCGGTGLYLKAFLDGLGDAPPSNAALRAELEAAPLATLLRELAQRDPALFETIDRQNPRRVVRAVEVIRLTGKPFSPQRAAWQSNGRSLASPFFFALNRPRADLHARIEARVDAMFAQGLVEETRRLLDRGLAQNRTAMQAIGYRQVAECLRGERSLPATIELIKVKTRQFAKRQLTWLRRHANARWVELTGADAGARAGQTILAQWNGQEEPGG